MHRQGFTLIELSIVLVIIGLIVGGVVTGRTLIKTAELRTIVTEEQRYVTAINVFKDKYYALPGDMPNATSLWGSAGGNGSDSACETASSTNTATCNGNNDSQIWTGAGGATLSEIYRSWQHLSNAKLIEGSFTGKAGPVLYADGLPGINQPASKIANGAWTFWTIYSWGTFGKAGLSLFIGADDKSGTGLYSFRPLLTGTDAQSIDAKLDDGKPGTGKVTTLDGTNSYVNGCATSTDPTIAIYFTTDNILRCMLVFWLE